MESALFENSSSGKLIRAPGGYRAFVPHQLPPKLEWDDSLVSLISSADIALGTVSGLGETLPNAHLLIYPFIKREAVLSSRIEGTQSSFSARLLFEATQVETQPDVREVQNYVRTIEYGLKRLDELPLSLRLIRELHAILMEGVRGEQSTPGEFRHSQNWIGSPGCSLSEATFVPPPVPEMHEALADLEKFLHTETNLPQLVQLALVHYQFEAVHPFLDGNGRIGRLLITLFLCERKLLSQPLLYLSAFFEQYRQDYYDLLLEVSQTGAWRKWIEFFLRAVVNQSNDAVQRARLMLDLQRSYRQISIGKYMPPTAGKLVDLIFAKPVLNAKMAQERLGVTYPAVQKAIHLLEGEGILTEITGGKRNKVYEATEILEILERDIAQEQWKGEREAMRRSTDAYLDIETTGLSPSYDAITVIGIYRCHGRDSELIQLVGEEVTRGNLLTALRGVNTIYTYNGSRFDIPFIAASLGIDLATDFYHHDLMYDCWRNNLYGGFKAVERQLGIPRQLTGVDGYEAVQLWWQYRKGGNQNALALLLQYNQEDVVNLKALRERLAGRRV